jgi:hypothetical protein
MSGVVPVVPRFKFTNAAGVPIAGGSVTVYLAGTTTLASTYQDRALTTLNTNPVTLDANGECLFWTSSANDYKFLLKDAAGATVSGWPVDNIPGNGSGSFVQDGTGAVERTAQAKMREVLSAEDFGVSTSNSAAQNTTALLNLRNYMRDNPLRHFEIRLPRGLIQHQDAKWLHNVRSVTVKGGPTRLQNTLVSSSTTEKIPLWLNEFLLDSAGTPAGYGTQVNGYLIDTVAKGASAVTLTTAAEDTNFAANTWALVYGYNQTSNGYPPSMRYFEYRRIKSVSSGVITFYAPLVNEYRSDWVDLATNSDQLFGKARVLPLERTNFKMMDLCELEDLEFLSSDGYVDDGTASSLGGSLYAGGCIKFIGRRLRINGYFYPTQGMSAELEDCWIRYTEVDKLIDRVTFRNCDIQQLENGPACNFLKLEGGRVLSPISSLNCRNFHSEWTRFSPSTTAGQYIAPAASIRQESIRLLNPIFDAVDPREDSKVAPDQTGMTNVQIKLDPASSAVDDYYNGMQVSILSGTGLRQIRTISDYVGSTKIATVSVAWVTQPDATSVYRLDRVLPILSSGSTVSVTVVAVTAPNKITCAYAGLNDSVLRGVGVGSVLKSTTTDVQIKVGRLYYDGSNTVIEGMWTGGTPAPAEVFAANIVGQVLIENPQFITTQPEYRNNTGAPSDLVASGTTAPAFDELAITAKGRTPNRITIPFLFFRDRTGTASMRINVNAVVLGFQVYVSEAYAGASGTATLIVTRPTAEGTSPYSQTINLKTTGGRRMDASGTSTALAGDTLQAVPPAFHKQINLQTNDNLSDDAIAGYLVIETAQA